MATAAQDEHGGGNRPKGKSVKFHDSANQNTELLTVEKPAITSRHGGRYRSNTVTEAPYANTETRSSMKRHYNRVHSCSSSTNAAEKGFSYKTFQRAFHDKPYVRSSGKRKLSAAVSLPSVIKDRAKERALERRRLKPIKNPDYSEKHETGQGFGTIEVGLTARALPLPTKPKSNAEKKHYTLLRSERPESSIIHVLDLDRGIRMSESDDDVFYPTCLPLSQARSVPSIVHMFQFPPPPTSTPPPTPGVVTKSLKRCHSIECQTSLCGDMSPRQLEDDPIE